MISCNKLSALPWAGPFAASRFFARMSVVRNRILSVTPLFYAEDFSSQEILQYLQTELAKKETGVPSTLD